MLRSITKDIVNAGSTEALQDFFTTPEGTRRTVKSITCENAADVMVRAYLDQDRVVEFGLEAEVIQSAFPPAFDIEVPVGRTFKAGTYETAGSAQTLQVTVWFDELTA